MEENYYSADASNPIKLDQQLTTTTSFSSKGLDKAILERLKEAYGRAKNKKHLPKELVAKQERERKRKRVEANKSRKMNQAKARLNKFQKKK